MKLTWANHRILKTSALAWFIGFVTKGSRSVEHLKLWLSEKRLEVVGHGSRETVE